MRLWRKSNIAPEGKYLVLRRDGTVPEWPNFVLGARDPAAPNALYAYADAAEKMGYDPEFVADIRTLANEFNNYCHEHGQGDPCAGPHRTDDPKIIELMRQGNNS